MSSGDLQASEQSAMIVKVVANVLDKLIAGNGDPSQYGILGGKSFLMFQSSYAPDVKIESYLGRILRYSRCSDGCFVMALVYVDRLIETQQLVLTSLNAHRLLITCVMLAAKFHDDLFYNNAYYSKLGGLSLGELNHLEVQLLTLLNYRLFVSENAYGKYTKQLQNYVFYLEVAPSPTTPVPTPDTRACPGSAHVMYSSCQLPQPNCVPFPPVPPVVEEMTSFPNTAVLGVHTSTCTLPQQNLQATTGSNQAYYHGRGCDYQHQRQLQPQTPNLPLEVPVPSRRDLHVTTSSSTSCTINISTSGSTGEWPQQYQYIPRIPSPDNPHAKGTAISDNWPSSYGELSPPPSTDMRSAATAAATTSTTTYWPRPQQHQQQDYCSSSSSSSSSGEPSLYLNPPCMSLRPYGNSAATHYNATSSSGRSSRSIDTANTILDPAMSPTHNPVHLSLEFNVNDCVHVTGCDFALQMGGSGSGSGGSVDCCDYASTTTDSNCSTRSCTPPPPLHSTMAAAANPPPPPPLPSYYAYAPEQARTSAAAGATTSTSSNGHYFDHQQGSAVGNVGDVIIPPPPGPEQSFHYRVDGGSAATSSRTYYYADSMSCCALNSGGGPVHCDAAYYPCSKQYHRSAAYHHYQQQHNQQQQQQQRGCWVHGYGGRGATRSSNSEHVAHVDPPHHHSYEMHSSVAASAVQDPPRQKLIQGGVCGVDGRGPHDIMGGLHPAARDHDERGGGLRICTDAASLQSSRAPQFSHFSSAAAAAGYTTPARLLVPRTQQQQQQQPYSLQGGGGYIQPAVLGNGQYPPQRDDFTGGGGHSQELSPCGIARSGSFGLQQPQQHYHHHHHHQPQNQKDVAPAVTPVMASGQQFVASAQPRKLFHRSVQQYTTNAF